MRRHSKEQIESLRQAFQDPRIRDFYSETTEDPEQFYRVNQGFEDNDARIRFTGPKFDETDISDRYEAVTDATMSAQVALGNTIEGVVASIDPELRLTMQAKLNTMRKIGSKVLPYEVETFFKTDKVAEASKSYACTRDESYKELLFWSRHLGTASSMVSFLRLARDPVAARQFLRDATARHQSFTGLSDDIDATMLRDSTANRRTDEIKQSLRQYTLDQNRERLQAKLASTNNAAMALAIGAMSKLHVGRTRQEALLFGQLRSITKLAPVSMRFLEANLKAQPITKN
jgi:hypothetical protein